MFLAASNMTEFVSVFLDFSFGGYESAVTIHHFFF